MQIATCIYCFLINKYYLIHDITPGDNGPSTNAPSTGSEDIRTSHGYGPKDRPRNPDPSK